MALLEVKDIHKKFGDLTVLDGVDLSIEKGDVVSVLGICPRTVRFRQNNAAAMYQFS